jgi:hypothetical protein
MWTCKNCDADVESTFEICWSCGATREGVADPGFDPEREGIIGPEEFMAAQDARAKEELVVLGTFWSAPEAHILRSRLEAEGIPALVEDDLATTTTWGNLNIGGGVKLAVPQSRAEQARRILDQDKEASKHLSPDEDRISAVPLPPPDLPDEEVERTADDMTNHAYRSAILGLPQFLACGAPLFFAPTAWIVLFVLPLIVPGYSLYWLYRARQSSDQLSPAGRRRYLVALVIDVGCFGMIFLALVVRIAALIAEW